MKQAVVVSCSLAARFVPGWKLRRTHRILANGLWPEVFAEG